MFYEKRVCVLYCAVVISASFLIARLYNLSKPDTNDSVAVLDGQYTGKIKVCERSGFVYDRNGHLLSHRLSGQIALVNPAECDDALRCADFLSSVSVSASCSEIYERILNGVPFTLTLRAESHQRLPDGVSVFNAYEENTDTAVHFMGYSDGDGRGVCGLRYAYDDLLCRMAYVSASFDTNAKRESLSAFEIDAKDYLSDDGVITTLDRDLQKYVDDLDKTIPCGAVVVADIKSGEILALSSFPAYRKQNVADLLDSDRGELVNRAAMSFTPGSVFKILVVAAALEKDVSLFDFEYTCTGEIEVGEDVFRCHKHTGHGEISMDEAFSESCNTYFIKLGEMLGLDCIAEMMKRLELDVPARASFVRETANYFPDTENKAAGYLANISFGQGDLCLSPLDMTRVTIAAASGYLPTLSTVRGEKRDGGFKFNERGKTKRVLSESTCEKILGMMEKCTNEGTGRVSASDKIKIGGKTATAQTGRYSSDGVEYVHKWFCGVFPVDNPEVSVCVLCDNVTDENVSPAVIFSQICAFLNEKGF